MRILKLAKTMSRRFFSLSEITNRISDILAPYSSKYFWVKAEISSFRFRSGNLYCELVESDSKNNPIAKLSCFIWASNLKNIEQKFSTAGLEFRLEDGLMLGLYCKIQYHNLYGLSLHALDADPSVTLGMLELDKQRIINQLRSEGLFEVNKKKYVPPLPNKIGLITGNNSAAQADFYKTISNSPFGIKIYFADSHMQGNLTEKSILKALSIFENSYVDLVIIIRGGGSKLDLYSLDNEFIARKIAKFNKPVWTGIGHETDTSVLDFVANQYFKTPTAVAEEIVSRFNLTAIKLSNSKKSLQNVWNSVLKSQKEFIDREIIGIRQGTRKLLENVSSNLDSNKNKLSEKVVSRISKEQFYINKLHSSLLNLSKSYLIQYRYSLNNYFKEIKLSSYNNLSRNIANFSFLKDQFSFNRFQIRLNKKHNYHIQLSDSLMRKSKNQINSHKSHLMKIIPRFSLSKCLKLIVAQRKINLSRAALINSHDPRNILNRGYAIITDDSGNLIRSISQPQLGVTIVSELNDGIIKSKIFLKEKK